MPRRQPKPDQAAEAGQHEERSYLVIGRIFLSVEEQYPAIGDTIKLTADRAQVLLDQGLIEEVNPRQDEQPVDEEQAQDSTKE